MASLNLSANGPSITKSYQAVVKAANPSGPAASSPTYGQWALFSVSAPLITAFQQDAGGKESVMKVQSSGDGELADLIDEFSDGRIQFAFVRVKDPNSRLPKFVLIGWCGEGVPERTKGYFTSHLATVSKTLHGYHVQITARSDRDLTPEGIIQKVSQASGPKYSSAAAPELAKPSAPPPAPASKPAFTPTRVGGGSSSGFNPLAGKRSAGAGSGRNADADGWGDDAPPVTRTELEKVQSAYRPTKVDMKELTSRKRDDAQSDTRQNLGGSGRPDVVKGGYQPVGKVDLAAIRRQAQDVGTSRNDRPEPVKGAYEPVGKVDIAAIRARAKPQSPDSGERPTNPSSSEQIGRHDTGRSAASPATSTHQAERLTALPRPKVGKASGDGASAFRGTQPPRPGGFGLESKPSVAAPVIGAAGRSFADQAGKTPAQLWAEKKARERAASGASATASGAASPLSSIQAGGEWASGSSGKSWTPVQTAGTSRVDDHNEAPKDAGSTPEPASDEPRVSVGALRDRFKSGGAAAAGLLSGASTKPRAETAPKQAPPSASIPILPSRAVHEETDTEREEAEGGPQDTETADSAAAARIPTPPAMPRSPTPPTPPAVRSGSPIRVAMPVSRSQPVELEPPADLRSLPPPVSAEAIARVAPVDTQDGDDDEPATGPDPARAAAEAAAAATFGEAATEAAATYPDAQGVGGKSALVTYDYEKAEDNEIELKEGEYVTDIQMVDDDWWMGRNSKGEMGLFPSNYVELVDDQHQQPGQHNEQQYQQPPHEAAAEEADDAGEEQHHSHSAVAADAAHTAADAPPGPTATALYDYEAGEENELTFSEGDKITGIEFPDDDWWIGHLGDREGLFPANYVELDK